MSPLPLIIRSNPSSSLRLSLSLSLPLNQFLLPIGKAKIEREGSDITLVAHSKMVGNCLEVAEALFKSDGIKAEVINLRSIRPLDMETIIAVRSFVSRIKSIEGKV